MTGPINANAIKIQKITERRVFEALMIGAIYWGGINFGHPSSPAVSKRKLKNGNAGADDGTGCGADGSADGGSTNGGAEGKGNEGRHQFPLPRRSFFPRQNSFWEGALCDAPNEIFTNEVEQNPDAEFQQRVEVRLGLQLSICASLVNGIRTRLGFFSFIRKFRL